jgi:ABC-2 type transport system permease protein
VITQLRSEAYKFLTTRTTTSVLAAAAGVAVLAMAVHVLGLPLDEVSTATGQRGLMVEVAVNLGILFSALLGALAITAEFRTGTIRPTLLFTPRRSRVLAAKAVVALAAGAVTGLLAAAATLGAGTAGLTVRGVTTQVSAGDAIRLLVGVPAAGALWAVIGLGVGVVARSQVPTVVALFTWLLFIENVFAGGLPHVHRFVPGSLAQSLAGATGPGVVASAVTAAVLLVLCTAAVGLAGLAVIVRRDVP